MFWFTQRIKKKKKLFAIGFPYKHCNFWPLCLPVKMASKTVIRPMLPEVASQGQHFRDRGWLVAFVKERFHIAVEIDILGIFEGYSSLQICPPPKKFFRGEIIQGEWRNFHQARALYLTEVLTCVLVCFLVEFWTVLPCLFMFTNTIAYAFRC